MNRSPRFDGMRVLVTGAASGIGRETALAFARQGADLVICDIDEKGLDGVASSARALGRRVFARRVDVSKRDEMRSFAEEVHADGGPLDVLVNNAGVAISGGFLETSLDDWDWILSINLLGVIHGCHFFLPPMVERKRGHVVNVSSVAGFFAPAVLGAYCTTKFGVFGLSEALRAELAVHGLGVTTICPGIIDTPIVGATRRRGKMVAPELQARVVELYKKRGYGPEKVASVILDAVARKRGVVPVTAEAWFLYAAKRIAPSLSARVFSLIAEKTAG